MNGNNSASSDPLTTKQTSSLEVDTTSNNNNVPQQTPLGFLQSLWALIAAYAMYYRGVTSVILVTFFIIVVVVGLDSMASSVASRKFHHLSRDYEEYSELELQQAQIDHWCLQGGDDHCRCNDPTEPLSREERRGWIKAHHANKESFNSLNTNWDVVLLGDELVEDFQGTVRGQPAPELKNVAKYWDATFTINGGGGDVEGLALGIAGDSISNLLWRIQHGELPEAKVYWIQIGTNDFVPGQCSEQVILLGILRLAEWIHDECPDSVIVINSILPRHDVFAPKLKRNKAPSPDVVWSAIQEVNAQLQSFCIHHEHLVYFDSTPLFVNSNLHSNKKHGGNTLRNPMYEQDQFHLSLQGHKTWGNAILERLKLILYDDDESSNLF